MVKKTGPPADAKPKIQKVPSMLRDNDKFNKYFQPKMFSFGPRYHRDPSLKMAKQIKVNLAADFLQQNEKIKELKDCYEDEFTKNYEDHELAWMFLVDGCAILQFMYISVDFQADPDPETQLRKLGIQTDYLRQDLFLLENQLPYQL
ncbi:hypothetical protein Ddye_005619 [Dipteronia dyeriana]|uniref:Uncharacterized protein n=1 Tax=Dipteronia dyeriana TaxID=168575 RepID=A0AAD9XGF1_9ROSI|nr:hypothetical protein Ddye_005619 [Dipteronia dyeriana]